METNLIEDLRLLQPPDYSWLLWAGGAVALIGMGLWFWLRRAAAVAATPAGGTEAEYWVEAMRELERLASLLRPDQSRAYGMASTAALRRYIERRFGLHAPFQATEEFLVAAGGSDALPAADRERLAGFLRWCDLLKFGRAVAETEELQQLHRAALEFVLGSRPVPKVAAQPEGQAPKGES